MKKSFLVFLISFLIVFGLDFWIKQIVLEGFRFQSSMLSIILVFNKGVAFSMLSFLGDWLKYIQIVFIVLACGLLLRQKEFFTRNDYALGIIFGAGCSNILDRFLYGGVVDYVYWHYGFEFAIFNFADVMIDVGIGILILKMFLSKSK